MIIFNRNFTQRSGDKKCNNLRTRNNTFKTMFCSLTDCKFSYLTRFSPLQFHLPVDDILFPVDLNRCRHTYNDYQAPSTLIPIAFSFLIQTYHVPVYTWLIRIEFACPHASDGIRRIPSRETQAYTVY